MRGKVLLPVLGKPLREVLARRRDHAGARSRTVPWRAISSSAFRSRAADRRWRRPSKPLLSRQHYRLAFWRVANDEINWRRFFDINELVGLRMEHPACFEDVHALIFRLYAEGLIDGVRVDQSTGSPIRRGYCRTLRARLDALTGERPAGAPRERAYIVVEKILLRGETLPTDWDCDGTSGYDFMNEVSAVQHDARGEAPLGALWQIGQRTTRGFRARGAGGAARDHRAQLFGAARGVRGELSSPRARRRRRDVSRAVVAPRADRAAGAFPGLSHLCDGRRAAGERRARSSTAAIAGAKATCLSIGSRGCRSAASLARRARRCGARRDPGARRHPIPAAQRAGRRQGGRGHRLLSLRPAALAQRCRLRRRRASATAPRTSTRTCCGGQADFPHAMLATATHDHKRGEDVRARLAVLSEYADEWAAAVPRWIAQCAPLARRARCRIRATSPCCCR